MTERRPDLIPAWVDGTLTPVDKLRAHQEGLRHKAVSVFVVRGREILMQRRAMGKYHTPGLWANTCCTHPQWREASDRCAVRRAYERFGGRTLDVGQDAIELEEATKRFVESGRDMGALIRALVLARTTGW